MFWILQGILYYKRIIQYRMSVDIVVY